MKKNEKLQLSKTSYILMIAAAIALFILIVYISYSLYGGKGTYSIDSSCSNGQTCYDCLTGTRYRIASSNPDTRNCTEADKSYCSGCASSEVYGPPAPSTWTIRFDPNGGVIHNSGYIYTITATAGQTYYAPTATNANCDFSHWTKNGSTVTFPQTANSAATYVAQWKNCACLTVESCYECSGTPEYRWLCAGENVPSNCIVNNNYTTKTACVNANNTGVGLTYACYDCAGGTPRYKWASSNPNPNACSKLSGYSSESACTSQNISAACYDCTGGTPRYKWASSNPNPNSCLIARAYTTQSACSNANSTETNGGGGTGGGGATGGGATDVGNASGVGTGGAGATGSGDVDPSKIPGAPFNDTIKGDRCYNGTWVKVMDCQAESISNAYCKLSDGKLVLRHGGGLTEGYGCKDLPNAYSDIIDDYRCNKVSGKWIYITTCQPNNLIGAKCKTSDDKIIRTNLTFGSGCSGEKPGGGSTSTDTTGNGNNSSNVSNPQTGTIEMVVALIIAACALVISCYYFTKNKFLNIKG